MLERYSHIRMKAKREAVEALSLTAKRFAKADAPAKDSSKVSNPNSIN